MTHPPHETLRAYATGEVDVTKRLLVEAHLALCPTCPQLVPECHSMDAWLPEATVGDEVHLPSFDRVWAAVQRAAAKRRFHGAAILPASLSTTLPDPAGWRWVAWPRRVEFTLLIRDAEAGGELYLSYFAPGSRFPRHRHVGLEENVILSGGYQDGNVHVEASDWVVGAPGTEHMPTTDADEECWCLSRIESPGLRFIGWHAS